MITAVDTNVLPDVFGADAIHGIRSANALRHCLREGALVACEAVRAETAALRASTSWRLYRSRGGKRESVVADFLIGAHALIQCGRILTRDLRFYRDSFRELAIVGPAEHPG